MCPLLSEPTRQPSHVWLNCLHSQPGTENERTKASWALYFCEQSRLSPTSVVAIGTSLERKKRTGFPSQGGPLTQLCLFWRRVCIWASYYSCSAAQTILQVSHRCLPSVPLQLFTGTGRLCCESQCRMQPQLPGHVLGLVCSVTGTKGRSTQRQSQARPWCLLPSLNTFHLESSPTQRSRSAQLSISGCRVQVPLGWKLSELRPIFLPL